MFAVLFGSYSIAATFPGTPSLFLLISMILYFLFAPPPLCLEVVLPYEFLPPDLLRLLVKDFSGVVFVISSNPSTLIERKPAEVGLYFLIAILIYLLLHTFEELYSFRIIC